MNAILDEQRKIVVDEIQEAGFAETYQRIVDEFRLTELPTEDVLALFSVVMEMNTTKRQADFLILMAGIMGKQLNDVRQRLGLLPVAIPQ